VFGCKDKKAFYQGSFGSKINPRFSEIVKGFLDEL